MNITIAKKRVFAANRAAYTITFFLFVLFASLSPGQARADALRVDAAATPGGDGTSWTLAFQTIGDALTSATPGDTIWVASGLYEETLEAKSGVAILGGFAGDETTTTQRNATASLSIIDVNAVNAFHAVTLDGVTTFTLDGFLIRGGSAFGSGREGNGGGIYCVNSDATNAIINCMIAGNWANIGGGIYCKSSSPAIIRCTISANLANWGGGIFLEDASPELTNCAISGNLAQYGAALNCSQRSAPRLTNCSIVDNSAMGANSLAGGVYCISSSSPVIVNTIFANNADFALYEADGASNPSLAYCLFHNNPDGDYMHFEQGPYSNANDLNLYVSSVERAIQGDPMLGPGVAQGVWQGQPALIAGRRSTIFTDPAASFTPNELSGRLLKPNVEQAVHALITSNTATTIEVKGDLSIFATSGTQYSLVDFHLADGSAALDRARLADAPANDIDLETRPGADGLADIGVDEALADFHATTDTIAPVSFALPLDQLHTTPIFEIEFLFSDAESGAVDVELYYSKDGTSYISAGSFAQSPILFDSAANGGDGGYAFHTRARDAAGNIEAPPATPDAETLVITQVAGGRLYVDADANGGRIGSDWTNALNDLDLAVEIGDAFSSVTEIWTAAGVYTGTVSLRSGLALYGGFAGDETQLDGRNTTENLTVLDGAGLADHVVVMNGVKNVRLDGFTITGGRANGPEYSGGGIYCIGADNTNTIANCVIAGNSAVIQNAHGGGVYCSNSSPAFVNCRIAGNTADSLGGGVYGRNCDSIFTNCIVAGNTAAFGGALYLEASDPILRNCTIADNAIAGSTGNPIGGGLYCRSSSPELTNCILSGNEKYAVFEGDTSADPILASCLIYGNTTGDYFDLDTAAQTGANALNMNVAEASNNIQGPPLFAGQGTSATIGVWTAAPAYDAASNRTTLTDANTTLTLDALAGRLLTPNFSERTKALILSNTTYTMTVSGDARSLAPSGAIWGVADYHLLDGSSALDRATIDTLTTSDIDGEPRPGDDGLGDIGADEAPGALTPPSDTISPISFALPLPALMTTATFDIAYKASDAESGLFNIELFFSKDDGPYQSAGLYNSSPIPFDSTLLGDGRYAFHTVGRDRANNLESPPPTPDANTVVLTNFTGERLFVDQKSTGTQLGVDWSRALHSIGVALDAAVQFNTVKEIWVAGGVYNESLDLVTSVSLYGGFSGVEILFEDRSTTANLTIIDAGGANHAISAESVDNIRVDGFIITGGLTAGTGNDGYGGGILIDRAGDNIIFANCVISGNAALATDGFGGGVFCSRSDPTFVNCLIAGNIAGDYGGAMYLIDCDPTLINCTVADNDAIRSGGGIYCYSSSPWLINTIFSRNTRQAVYENTASSDPPTTACLFFNNPDGDYFDRGFGTLTGADAINTSLTEVNGVVDGDPAFVVEIAGVWTDEPAYDAATNRTTLSLGADFFLPGELAGRFLNPNVGQYRQALILANTSSVIVVSGRVDYAQTGDAFEVASYRLGYKSHAIDVGTARTAPPADIDGRPRPVDISGYGADATGEEFDIGVYEAQETPPPLLPRMIPEPAWTPGLDNTVTWYYVSGATSYTLQIDMSEGFPLELSQDVAAPTRSMSFTGLQDGVTYWYRFRALTTDGLTSWSEPTFSTQDNTNPSGSLLIDNGAPLAIAPEVELRLAVQDAGTTPSGVAQMRFDHGAGWTSWEPFATTRTWTLEPIEGLHTVKGQVRDRAGNISVIFQDQIELDMPEPRVLSITPLDPGPTSADSIDFIVVFDKPVFGFDEPSDILIVHDPDGSTAHASVAISPISGSEYRVTVGGITGNGSFTLEVVAGACDDGFGHLSIASGPSVPVLIDQAMPALIPEPFWTRGTTNTLEWFAFPGATSYTLQMANSEDFAAPVQAGVAPGSLSHAFTGLVNGQTYWYRLRVRVGATVTSWSLAVSSTQDASAPTGTVLINGGVSLTNFTTITLDLTASDIGAGVDAMRFNDNAGWSEWQPFATTHSWTLSVGDGTRSVWAEYRDAVGNVSTAGAISDSIVLDTLEFREPRVLSVTPETVGPTGQDAVVFTVIFDKDVTGFDASADVIVAHDLSGATTHSTVSIAQVSPTEYTVTVGDIMGTGALALWIVEGACRDAQGRDNAPFGPSPSVLIDNMTPEMIEEPFWTAGAENEVAWQRYDFAESYEIQVADSSDFADPASAQVAAPTLTHTFTDLADGATYWYRMRATVAGFTTATIWSLPVFSTQDGVAPTGTIVIAADADYTNTPDVALSLTSQDAGTTPSRVVEMRFNDGAGWSPWETVADSKAWTFSPGDGLRAIFVEFRDLAGNISETGAINDTIVLDTSGSAAPRVISITPQNFGPTGATEIDFRVVFDKAVTGFSDPGDVTVDHDPQGTSVHTNITIVAESSFSYIVTVGGISGKGSFTLRVNAGACKDFIGNDNIASAPSAAVAIDDSIPAMASEPQWTAGTENTVAWYALASATGYTIQRSETANFAAPESVDLPASALAHTFTGLADGLTYWYRVRGNLAGGPSIWSAVTQSTQDATLPTGTIAVNGGATILGALNVTLALSASDAGSNPSGVSAMRIDDGEGWGDWETYTLTKTWTLSEGDGPRTVRAQYRDAAGNLSAAAQASFTLDSTPPTVAMTTAATEPTTYSLIHVVAIFSEDITGFTLSDLVLSSATASNFVAVDALTYTFDLSPTASGLFTVDIPAGAASDQANNANVAADQLARTYAPILPLAPPENVTATDGAFVDTVRVSWNASPEATHYRLYRSESLLAQPRAMSDWITSTSLDDATVVRGATYYYWALAAASDKGYRVSSFGVPDAGWANAPMRDYKVTYKACDLSAPAGALGLLAANTTPDCSIKIKLLKKLPKKMDDVPGKSFYYRSGIIPKITIAGSATKLYTDAPVKLLEAGSLRSLTAQGGHIERIESSGGLGTVKMSAAPNATFPETNELTLATTEIFATGDPGYDAKITLTGIVLGEFSMPAQTVKSLKSSAKKNKKKGVGTFLSPGGVSNGVIEALELRSLSVKGGALAAEEISTLIGTKPMKIAAKSGVFKVGLKKAETTVLIQGDVAVDTIDTAAPALSVTAGGGDLLGRLVMAAGDLKKLSASFKKARVDGQTQYIGGHLGQDLDDDAAATTYTLFVSGAGIASNAKDIKSVSAGLSIRGAFMAGADVDWADPTPIVPNFEGLLVKMTVKKANVKKGGTTEIVGESWSSPDKATKFKGVDLDANKVPLGFAVHEPAP